MPRLARLDARSPRLSPPQADDGGQAPGVLYDVIIRGIERRPGVVYVVRRAVRRGERIANERAIEFIH